MSLLMLLQRFFFKCYSLSSSSTTLSSPSPSFSFSSSSPRLLKYSLLYFHHLVKENIPPAALVSNPPSQMGRNEPELEINTQTASLNSYARGCRVSKNKRSTKAVFRHEWNIFEKQSLELNYLMQFVWVLVSPLYHKETHPSLCIWTVWFPVSIVLITLPSPSTQRVW